MVDTPFSSLAGGMGNQANVFLMTTVLKKPILENRSCLLCDCAFFLLDKRRCGMEIFSCSSS